ncbi:hypothetical protein J6590_072352 [Homalodisca vitripennis]|nr:hypothetical protein J6590_072352 [Homalodisca vitripennis]
MFQWCLNRFCIHDDEATLHCILDIQLFPKKRHRKSDAVADFTPEIRSNVRPKGSKNNRRLRTKKFKTNPPLPIVFTLEITRDSTSTSCLKPKTSSMIHINKAYFSSMENLPTLESKKSDTRTVHFNSV